MDISNAWLTLYLPFSNTAHMALMHGHMNEWHGKKRNKPNLACDSKQACEVEVPAHISMWTDFKKEQNMWNKLNKQHKEFGLGFLGKLLHT